MEPFGSMGSTRTRQSHALSRRRSAPGFRWQQGSYPVAALTMPAEDAGAGLIVVGTSRAGPHLGRVRGQLVHHARVPVVLVPPDLTGRVSDGRPQAQGRHDGVEAGAEVFRGSPIRQPVSASCGRHDCFVFSRPVVRCCSRDEAFPSVAGPSDRDSAGLGSVAPDPGSAN